MERNVRNVVMVILSALLLTGCGSGTMEDDTVSEEGPITREKTELSFRTIDVGEAPDSVQKWIEKNRSNEAKKVFHADGKTYVVIMLGQKPTGGFAVEIEKMELEKIVSPESKAGKGTVKVTHNVTSPKKGSFNTQALTYPIAIAVLEGVRDYGFQFSTPIKPDKLEETTSDQSSENGSVSQQVSGRGKAELVQPQELTTDGYIKE